MKISLFNNLNYSNISQSRNVNYTSNSFIISKLNQDTVCFTGKTELEQLRKSGAKESFLKQVERSLWGDTNALRAYVMDEDISGSEENIKAILLATQVTPIKSLIPAFGKVLKYWKTPKEEVIKTISELGIDKNILKPLGYEENISFTGSDLRKKLEATGADKKLLKRIENSTYGDTNSLAAFVKMYGVKGTPENIKAMDIAIEHLKTEDDALIPDFEEIKGNMKANN